MKLVKSLMALLAIALAATACAGNSKGNKSNEKSVEQTKENNMGIIELNKTEFLNKVYNYETSPKEWKFEGDKPAIVDFYATWCGPCKALHPVLEELSKEYSGQINIYQIDVDKEKELASAFGIQSIPTLLLIPTKGDPQIMQGAQPKVQLKKAIDEFLLKKSTETK